MVTLKGIQAPAAQVKEMPAAQLAEWIKGNDIWALVVVASDNEVSIQSKPPEIQQVLEQFTDVFATPTGLPPERPYDHAIPLKPDASPFNSRPYRYSPAHKDEIEKQVRAMLEACIIVPSMSPYASPVLLVQKKDSSWKFCVDF